VHLYLGLLDLIKILTELNKKFEFHLMKVALEIVHAFYQQIDFRVKQQKDIEQRPLF
jgi:hypothetical protein